MFTLKTTIVNKLLVNLIKDIMYFLGASVEGLLEHLCVLHM
jgi:hypothetical protein